MLKKFEVKNYKSINDCSVDLGRFNVFIGENGCGKSNLLEALAMASVAKFNSEITTEELYNKGVRVANPRLTFSSFKGKKQKQIVKLNLKLDGSLRFYSELMCKNIENIFSTWTEINDNVISEFPDDEDDEAGVKSALKTLYEIGDKFFTKDNHDNVKDVLNPVTNAKFLGEYKKSLSSSITKYYFPELEEFVIYNVETKALRGIISESRKQPLGINGEGLDVLIASFDKEELNNLLNYSYFISWFDKVVVDNKDILKYQGHKLGKSNSILYFKDKFMNLKNNIFSAENANEGILHVLFYLALFISKKTPKFFAIDNIEKSLNPKLCRTLIKELANISKETDKQALITTHNPAILDGLNLHDDEQRLFVVSRTDEGHTKIERIKLKPETKEPNLKLSEMWMRGLLGGVPNNF